MSGHAILSASGSKKWLNCPKSVTLEKEFEDEESIYAKEGTVAHALGELKIKHYINAMSLTEYSVERTKLLADYDIEDIQELDEFTDTYKEFVMERYNNALRNCKDAEILIEERLDYSKYAKDGFGTGDIVICDFESIEIIDFKYGKGVKVDAFENSQLMLYGLGALEIYDCLCDIKSIKMTIFQPRLDNISTYEISTEDLINWGENIVKPKSEIAFKGLGECVYGSHCDEGFCKARPLCKAYNGQHLQVTKYAKKHPDLLTEKELVDAYEIANTYKKWLALLEEYILSEMLKGKKLLGLKLVEGRSLRKFTDENEVIKILKANGFKKKDYITEKLIGVATAEKLLGKQKFQEVLGDVTEKPIGSPTIAKIEDKRPEYNSAELDFANINY